ncbi:hypothetical protein Tco_0749220 [Tanacetum coccineum]|uniref:Uncharacterized protein n=1 Tax=Tanacetum coccineum TaxID=301880 RepID=A0ABQ4YXY8_9ASTR
MMILNEFLTEEIYATDDFKEYETVFVGVDWEEEEANCEKDDDDSEDRLEPGSHKENPEHVDHDDDDEENVDEKKDAKMGSLETRTEEMQTPIPTTPRSPRTILSSDKNITQELTDTVSLPTVTTSKNPHSKRRISSKYSHLPVDQVLHTIVPQLSERATDDLIENNLKPSIAATISEDHDAFRSEVPDLISQEFKAQAPKIIEELFKNYVQSNVIQVHLTKTTSTKTTSSVDLQQQLDNDIHSQRHDDHQEDDAPPEGEKRVKRHKASRIRQQQESDAWVEEIVTDEDEVISENETLELITELQNVDKHVPTIFDRARIEATLNDMLSNQFKNAKEYAYHLEQATNFMENQIVLESRQEDIRRPVPRPLIFFRPQRNPNEPLRIREVIRIATDQPHGLDFMEQIIVMRENDKPDSFSEADFKYLNKNDIEDLYYLFRNKKIVKFCDATLEKVLKEVKLKIFQSKPWKKPPLLGELDRDIMRAFEREITKRLSHREQMRRWESFVNGRPIVPTMKRL